MTPAVRRFVVILFGAWTIFAAHSAVTDGVWMRWLLVLFLAWCISFVGRSNDAMTATILPPAAVALSLGLDALHREDLGVATACLVAFLGLLGVLVREARG